MADTGFVIAEAAEAAGIGDSGFGWDNPGNATADDGNLVTSNGGFVPGGTNFCYTNTFDLGAFVPTGATINGVEVFLEGATTSDGDGSISAVLVESDGQDFIGNTKSTSVTPTTDGITFGGPTDTWGATLTQSIIASNDFGVSISGQPPGFNTLSFDSAQIKIYYTASGGSETNDILVETFDVDVGASGSTHTLINDVGNVANAFVRKMTSTDKAVGRVGNTGNMNANDAHAGVEFTDTDELTFYKNNANTQKFVGEVWRYVGPSGGSNEFISRGSYAVTLAAGTASATLSVTGLVDRNKAVPIYNGANYNGTTRNDYDASTLGIYINSSDEIVVERQSTAGTITAYVEVVEFTGSNWSVGHAVHDSGNVAGGTLQTLTLNTDSTGTGGSTLDVGDWATAMIIDASLQGDTSETGLADVLLLPQAGATTTTLQYKLVSGGNADGAKYFHVIQHDDLSITRASNANYPEGNNSYTTASFPAGTPTDRDIEHLSLEWFVSTTGAGTAHARGRLTARITDATGTIQHWVQRSGNNVEARWGVVDLSAITSSSASGVTGSANITLGGMTASSTGTVTAAPIDGDADIDFGTLSVSSSGDVIISGDADINFGALTASSDGDIDVDGVANITLGDITLNSSGTAGFTGINGNADIDLGILSVSSLGDVNVSGDTNVDFGTLTLSATGSVFFTDISGNSDITLDEMTVDGQGIVRTTFLPPVRRKGTGGTLRLKEEYVRESSVNLINEKYRLQREEEEILLLIV
jgi:hypothetical protein